MKAMRLTGTLVLALVTVSCGMFGGGSGDEFVSAADRELTLHVKNQNFYDATLYAVDNGYRQRLGVVTGNAERTFRFRWTRLDLAIGIDLLAAGTSVTQPLYADVRSTIEDFVDDDALKSTEDTPIVFVPDNDDEFDPDVLFADFDGSLADELLTV